MEYLHRCQQCEQLDITNICFANDLLLFIRGDITSVQLIMERFAQFSASTGLKANKAKCKVFLGGVTSLEQASILHATGFVQGVLPFKYLGVPLANRRLSVHLCSPLIDKIVARIQHWKSKLLSYADIQQLIKRVLFSITGYWMQIFPLPKRCQSILNQSVGASYGHERRILARKHL